MKNSLLIIFPVVLFLSIFNLSILYLLKLISYIYQKQGMCRSRTSCHSSILCLYYLSQIRRLKFSAAYFYHSSYNGSHHIPQETVCRDGKFKFISNLFPMGMIDFTNIGFIVTSHFGKTSEIIIFKKNFTSLIHFFYIQRSSPMLPRKI